MPSDRVKKFEDEISDLGFSPAIHEQKHCLYDTSQKCYAGYTIDFCYVENKNTLTVPVCIEFFYDNTDIGFYRSLNKSLNLNLNQVTVDIIVDAYRNEWKTINYENLKQQELNFVSFYISAVGCIADKIFEDF